MRRCLIINLIIILSQVNGSGQSYGLAFSSHEAPFEKRTSLDLSPGDSLCLAKNFELGFDFHFIPNHKDYFGYVLRIINNGNKNIDIIYNHKLKLFRVIIEDNFSAISFSLDSPRMYREWTNFRLIFNSQKHTLQFTVNGKNAGITTLPSPLSCFKFLWGANDYTKFDTKDLPSMEIKDIRISEEGKLKYYWPLDQSFGDTSYDRVNGQMAKIKNPNWVKPKNQYWQLVSDFFIRGDAGVAYNSKQDEVYIAGSDSVAIFTLKNEKTPMRWQPSSHLNLRLGNQAVYDTINNKLYDIFVDQHRVASFDFSSGRWSQNFDSGRITEFWHFNKFVSPSDSNLYIIGGYGQMKYKNFIQRYTFRTGEWEMIPVNGDYFSPRYLAALGRESGKNNVYIIGGYGSKTGDQMLAPGNFYDLIRFDFRTKSFKNIYTLKSSGARFTFANSLTIDSSSGEYYALIYANDSSNSNLQLIKSSLTDSTFVFLGNSIPYRFHDIESFTDLYYSPVSNKLLTVVMHYAPIDDKERITEVKIYSINFSPAPLDIISQNPSKPTTRLYWIISAGLVVFVIGGIVFLKRRGFKKSWTTIPLPENFTQQELDSHSMANYGGEPDKRCKSSIFLFGQFQVFDKEAADITAQFSPLLKELFLLIVTSTLRNGRGISSAELDEILWHDKPDKDAKNNRAVNIAKLKALLEKIGDCTINKDSGFWQFQIISGSVCMDYKKYLNLINQEKFTSPETIHLLMDIIRKGPFLYQTEYGWLDDIKSEISNSVIDTCLGYVNNHPIARDLEFTIEICNCIFYFDHLNEDALIYKCKSLILLKRHTLANTMYMNFAREYKNIYGEIFPKTFQEIVS